MQKLYLKILVFISAFLFYNQFCTGQIVNVESLRKRTDTTGISGGMALNGSYLDNKKVIYTIGLIPNIQYKWDQVYLLLIGDYKLTKSENINFEDAAFLHLRYSHQYTELFRWESFMQIQDNKIAKLDYRYLIGSGLRMKVLGFEQFRLYLGVLPMYELERIIDIQQTINKTFRLSQYISMTVELGDQTKLYSTSYYQPVLGEYGDYRFFNEQKLMVNLVKNLYITISNVYTWDSRPPEDAPGRTLHMKTGLHYKF